MKLLVWFSAAATLFGTLYTDSLRTIQLKPAVKQPVAIVAPVAKAIPQTRVARRVVPSAVLAMGSRSYRYTFEGQALFAGQPCPNASVNLRVYSAHKEKLLHAQTGADGRYSATVSLMGSANEPMTWEIDAVSPDLHRAQLEGGRIMTEDASVTIDGSLNFIES